MEENKIETVDFTACGFLDFDRSKYVPEVKMNLISSDGDKVVWDRMNVDGRMELVQFCTKRGRLNCADACLSKKRARCSDYNEKVHSVPSKDIDLS